MSEDQILKCLIAFVLGYLVARMMRGNGLSVGGITKDYEQYEQYGINEHDILFGFTEKDIRFNPNCSNIYCIYGTLLEEGKKPSACEQKENKSVCDYCFGDTFKEEKEGGMFCTPIPYTHTNCNTDCTVTKEQKQEGIIDKCKNLDDRLCCQWCNTGAPVLNDDGTYRKCKRNERTCQRDFHH